MKKFVFAGVLLMTAMRSMAAEVWVNPLVSDYEITKSGVFNIWGATTACNPMKVDPSDGTPRSQLIHWENKLMKAQELGLSVRVLYTPSTCIIDLVGSMRSK
jgi:hypothetical protein